LRRIGAAIKRRPRLAHNFIFWKIARDSLGRAIILAMRRQSKSHHLPTKETERDQSTRGFWGRLIHEPINLFTAALAVVAIIQAWAFIASERAFVSVVSPDLSRVGSSPDQPLQIPLTVMDSGRSTARVTALNLTVMKNLPEKPQYIPLTRVSLKPLMVNAPEILLYRASPGPWLWKLSQSEIDNIERGDERLFIFGYIKYRDDFSVWGDKKTGFCFRYIPKPIIPNGHYETCDNGAYTYVW
jgi:hypothetical protein